MKQLAFLLFLLVHHYSWAQEVIDINGVDCTTHGNAKAGSRVYTLNELKNRYRFPAPADYDTTITLRKITAASEFAFSPATAVVVTGYVYDVKTGGVESCNCRSKDPMYMDTHIELTIGGNKTASDYRVIAEVTPRLRAIMAKQGKDWSTATLRNTIKGRYVKIAGWLLYDSEHRTEDYADDPNDSQGGENWRATGWEIHPITYMEIISKTHTADRDIPPTPRTTTNTDNNTTSPANTTQPSTETAPSTNYFLWGFIIAVVLLILYTSYKKKKG